MHFLAQLSMVNPLGQICIQAGSQTDDIFWSAALGIKDDAVESNGGPEEGQHKPLQLCAAAAC